MQAIVELSGDTGNNALPALLERLRGSGVRGLHGRAVPSDEELRRLEAVVIARSGGSLPPVATDNPVGASGGADEHQHGGNGGYIGDTSSREELAAELAQRAALLHKTQAGAAALQGADWAMAMG